MTTEYADDNDDDDDYDHDNGDHDHHDENNGVYHDNYIFVDHVEMTSIK